MQILIFFPVLKIRLPEILESWILLNKHQERILSAYSSKDVILAESSKQILPHHKKIFFSI